jgi:hypothetical protein
MGILTKEYTPLVSATKLNVPAAAVDDGSAVYGTYVTAPATKWVLGSAMPKGRKLLVVVNTGALTSTPTALKVALLGGGTDTSGSSAAEIASTVTAWATPAGNTSYLAEIDLAAVSDLTKYYSLGLASNGGGSTSIIAGATALVLDPAFVP